MTTKELDSLLRTLRRHGVTQYALDGLSITLGAAPPPPARTRPLEAQALPTQPVLDEDDPLFDAVKE
jgi:hypothetical protein